MFILFKIVCKMSHIGNAFSQKFFQLLARIPKVKNISRYGSHACLDYHIFINMNFLDCLPRPLCVNSMCNDTIHHIAV